MLNVPPRCPVCGDEWSMPALLGHVLLAHSEEPGVRSAVEEAIASWVDREFERQVQGTPLSGASPRGILSYGSED